MKGAAPIKRLSFSISAEGPAMSEVPVSAMASQPPLQKLPLVPTFILHKTGREKNALRELITCGNHVLTVVTFWGNMCIGPPWVFNVRSAVLGYVWGSRDENLLLKWPEALCGSSLCGWALLLGSELFRKSSRPAAASNCIFETWWSYLDAVKWRFSAQLNSHSAHYRVFRNMNTDTEDVGNIVKSRSRSVILSKV